MQSIVMMMRVLGGILAFFFGLFVCCFLADLVGLPNPMVYGDGWLAASLGLPVREGVGRREG